MESGDGFHLVVGRLETIGADFYALSMLPPVAETHTFLVLNVPQRPQVGSRRCQGF